MTTTPHDRRAGLRPPQFRLSTMLAGVAVVCILLAAMKWVGPLAGFGLLFLALSIVAHVAGNAIGTRLRENGSRPLPGESGGAIPRSKRYARPAAGDYAPATRLAARHPLGWLIVLTTGLAVLLGALAGGAFLAWFNWERTSLVSISVGALASGALGGFGGFLVSSFLRELLRANAQAAAAAKSVTCPPEGE